MLWHAMGAVQILSNQDQVIMSLYLWIDLLSISIPLLASFHPRLKLYQHWKSLFLAIGISMIPYIIWDIYFTQQGYWGFTDDYLSGIFLLGLPIEEWLFFICIPYACVFTHISLLEINKKLSLDSKLTHIITWILLGTMTIVAIGNFDLAYTIIDMVFAVVILALVRIYNANLLRTFYVTFLFILIPFFLVNGILTGSGITDQIVWYNDHENLGIRLYTIPIEDTVYAFSLILLNLFLFEKLKKFNIKKILD